MLVSALRHSQIGLLGNKNAEDFSIDNDEVKKIIKIIKNRCKKALIDNDIVSKEVDKNIDEITKLWNSRVEKCKAQPIGLVYDNKENGLDKSSETLLCDFHDAPLYSGPPWPTLQSMRNIEYVAAIEIIEPYG
jgi:hypothetical protein